MNHFFLPASAFTGSLVIFPKETSMQITKVLRLHSGDHVLVLDDLGSAFEVELDATAPKNVEGKIIHRRPAGNEPRTRVQLQICLTQREKFEWILQKCTELGVTEFIPLISSRTLIQKEEEVLSKYDRWRKILKEAAEQCERGRIPELLPPLKFKNILTQDPDTISLLLNEDEHHRSLGSLLAMHPEPKKLRLLVGPEGGFSSDEIELALREGYASAWLGNRILRMETAAIAATAIVMNALGEMG